VCSSLLARWMAARHRKTLVVCRSCHMSVQHGHPRSNKRL
jgi:hypothetical protein